MLHNNTENVYFLSKNAYQSFFFILFSSFIYNYQSLLKQMMHQSGCEGMPTGVDRRTSLWNQMQKQPYCSLLFLRCRNNNNRGDKYGTAFLIHPQYALTAAHNFFNQKFEYLSRAEVYPAAVCQIISSALQSNRQSKINVSQIKIPEVYLKNVSNIHKRYLYDYALIKLQKPVNKECLKLFTSSEEDIAGLSDKKVEICGYSRYLRQQRKGQKSELEFIKDMPFGISYFNPVTHSEKIIDIQKGIINYSVDTDKGQSGSPIIVDINGKKTVIGIHFYYNKLQKYGTGIFLNNERLQTIDSWLNEMEKPFINIYKLTSENTLESTTIQSAMLKKKSSSFDEKSEESLKIEREEWLRQEEEKSKKEKDLIQQLEIAQKDVIVSETEIITCFDIPHFFFNFKWQIKKKNQDFQIEGKRVKKISKNSHCLIASYEWVNFKKRNIIKCIFHQNNGMIWIGLLSKHILNQMQTDKTIIENIGRHSLLAFENSTDPYSYGRIYSFHEQKTTTDQKLFVQPNSYVGFDINSDCGTITLYVNTQPKIEIFDYDIFVKDQDIYLCVVMTAEGDSVSINQF